MHRQARDPGDEYKMDKADRMVVARYVILVGEVEPEMIEHTVLKLYYMNTRLM